MAILAYLSASLAANAQAAITNKMLKTAEPTMVPIPTSDLAIKTPMMEVKSSGAEPPAAMKVAPATSGVIFNCKKGKNIIRKEFKYVVLEIIHK